MSGLVLRLKQPIEQRLNLFGIVPDRLKDLSPADIADLRIATGTADTRLADWFEVIDGDRSKLTLQGDLTRADRIGGGMLEGLIQVDGDVGHEAAKNMRGGRLVINGSAGDYLSSDQRGGSVSVAGDVGRGCAAARPGSRRGMRGGSLVVEGNAGEAFGARMRRGTVVLYGETGGDVASGMIAGTIVLHRCVAGTIAVGMRRGTILYLSETHPERHSGFTPAELVELSYLPLLVKSLDEVSQRLFEQHLAASSVLSRSLGDRAIGGKGELIWFSPIVRAEPPVYVPVEDF